MDIIYPESDKFEYFVHFVTFAQKHHIPMKAGITLAAFVWAISAIASSASIPDRFESLPPINGMMTSVFSIAQDNDGFMWFGTDNGLVRYDGYSYRISRHRANDGSSLCNDIVNALYFSAEENLLYVGTDSGISLYDPVSESFRKYEECGERHVKSFLYDNGKLWVGTTTGIVCCSREGTTVFSDSEDSPVRLPSAHIACCRKIGDDIYFGSYDHFYRLRSDGHFEIHRFRQPSGSSGEVLLLDITAGGNGNIRLGTEAGMMDFDPDTGAYSSFLDNIPVKYFLTRNDARLLIGTDNGLYAEDGDGRLVHLRHEVGNSMSLPNNVIWSIFLDRAGNIWFGTDHGAAYAKADGTYSFHSLKNITGSDDGLDIGVIEADMYGNLWLGGRNGLIRYDTDSGKCIWYRSDSGAMRLSHNKVRDIYDDGRYMWIASDGGLDRYDRKLDAIRHFHITEPTGKYSSTWMYSICKDSRDRLWAGTYDGGIFVTGVSAFRNSGQSVTCGTHLCTASSPALSGNIVRTLEIFGGTCYAIIDGGIDAIDTETFSISRLTPPDGANALSLASSGKEIFVGTDMGLYSLEENGIFRRIPGNDRSIMNIVSDGSRLWTICGNGVYVLDTAIGVWSYIRTDISPVINGTVHNGKVFFGTVDGYIETEGKDIIKDREPAATVMTELAVDGIKVTAGMEYGGKKILESCISDTEEIILPRSIHSFSIGFSTFLFPVQGETFSYRMRGLDDNWQQTPELTNRAVFINVPAGEYIFEVRSGEPEDNCPVTALKVRIPPMWYATAPAYCTYAMIVLCMCFFVFRHIRTRQQLQIEHIEREKAIRMADMKTEFLSNVSHEFKSPLSIIIGFVGRMIASESDAIRTRELRTVQQNAEKIQILLDHMVSFNGNGSTSLFMPAATSLQMLAKDVYDRYSEAFREKEINTRFVCDDMKYIFMTDRLKMESVLQNLLSNALKFTPRGGSVLMSVTVGEETGDMVYADIRVEDTGCGIRKEELPYIFNRRYRAPSNMSENINGSGIGLDLVRKIVEMHKGRISVTSEEGKGTCFTIRLSTMKADSFILKGAENEDFTLHSLSKVWQHDRKPIILIVEDNQDIRDFIVASLGKDYTFLCAENGEAGLEIISGEKVDLVITDISMPGGMDGITMSRSIRNSLRTAFLPIIILTGKNDMQTQIQSFEYADAFIAKPFNLTYLNNRIIQLLIKHEQYLEKVRRQNMLEPRSEEVHSPDEKFLEEVISLVEKHIDDPEFSASALCDLGHYSQKQTYRKIKNLTGMNIVEFIRDIRLRKAAMYLAQGKLTVNEVMYKVGFTTASYFSKCFREKYGVSPSEYTSAQGKHTDGDHTSL